MPVYTDYIRKSSKSPRSTPLQNVSSQNSFTSSKMLGQQLASQVSVEDQDSLHSRSQNKSEEVNRTYVISACKNGDDASLTPKPRDRLMLQRRTRTGKSLASSSEQSGKDTPQGTENTQVEKRLTLQRRVKSGSIEKSKINGNAVPGAENSVSDAETKHKIALQPNICNDTHYIKPSCKLAEGQQVTKLNYKSNSKDLFDVENDGCTRSKCTMSGADARLQTEAPVSEQQAASNYVDRISGEQLNEKGDIKRMAARLRLQQLKHNSLERPRTPTKAWTEEFKLTPKNSTYQVKSSLPASSKPTANLPAVSEKKTSSPPVGRSAKADENAEALAENNSSEKDIFKVENSKVIVAVRVRPFSSREKKDNLLPVVSMSGSETSVRNPSTNQLYNFSYDFSFWSFDKCHSNFASQEMIYKTLALPLLERAFEGYNTCLFAYGQTGSGKSYTMMGFDEDRGIIPRLCEDLFTRIAQTNQQQVLYHLEMSYFEVYNEKIHDLLVFKAEGRQKKQPLRVREHPVLGPYVEDLTVNVVSSYSDIQSWLELGNKQRATAATVMNDKSSRSHSVFTLVMTQTKVKFVAEEQRDHRLTSHVNLIDLAGSECCSTAQTTGERLKEGVSINKSLLTLGKVISALSKLSRNGKKTFIPYRESVLTWLLKESLGGNSQTAMIATISPAASSTEETLSTLRYAKQACSIINMAKVNEDVNAKLIRELRAEIEKLKAAQKSAQNRDPEKYRHYLQEITSLRIKLHRQEKDMTEMQRAWKAKLEQAEKRKLEDIKELQKAGIAFRMDNRLPNLVNLNEDPQLSEVLLYMIKEGKTTVGRYTANSKHDIQLSGVLIADDHCIIENTAGQVSIIPLREAKTYVNGKCIVNQTVLHHGDRVILGGDHYFRFNHPVEVQKIKGPSCGTTILHDGPKDFEFAKNELLVAQRAQLESEIEEARLKAKEEMMQSVQIAKEMVQQELTSQKEAYESKIKSLEAEVREESRKKQVQELNNQKAASKIQELEMAKQNLELELHFNKKRLEMEALATKQALEDHTIRHAKILQALEDEKQKIAEEIESLQKNRGSGNKAMNTALNWNSLKLSVMIKEANTISNELRKNTVFNRHEKIDDRTGSVSSVQVQVRNLKLGIATFWSLEKFESKLAAMKELYESNDSNKAADVFYDPADEWEPDLSDASVSSLSRRSRSFMKNKRISGCLSGIKLQPIQSTSASYISGAQDKSSIHPNCFDSLLPGICKESISSALDLLEQNDEGGKSIADHLLINLFTISSGVSAISKAYEQQDEECQKNFISLDHDAQSFSIKITSAFDQLVVLTKTWLNNVQKCAGSMKVDEEIKQEVKNLGGYLQLLLQGCSSDISSMVTEAQSKVNEAVKQAMKCIGHLAVFTGTDISFFEENSIPTIILQDFLHAVYDGVGSGLELLTDAIREKATMMQKELVKQVPQNEIQSQIKDNAAALARFLESNVSHCGKVRIQSQLPEEECLYQEIKRSSNIAAKYLELERCLSEVHQIVSSTLQGSFRNTSLLRSFAGEISIIAGYLNNYFSLLALSSASANNPFQRTPVPFMNLDELDSLVDSLILSFELEQGQPEPKSQVACNGTTETEGRQVEMGEAELPGKQKGVAKHIYKLQSPPVLPGELSPDRMIEWV
ncbi:kinesin-like protein KIF14 [Coturnix japonica]|uniref:kinesin-like protein KIF14 n=1 Tax=Coturnix japonica TaxID=93934 RepID=UPI000777296D|nr:kinesin-like protein KIF14 [Coturnix japonica]XP_015724940.1 kinesin-like protein KIF14 [Coturnix japonica]XP_015724941.1 kinesin-like protein KIF14 [Coturnix japonica]